MKRFSIRKYMKPMRDRLWRLPGKTPFRIPVRRIAECLKDIQSGFILFTHGHKEAIRYYGLLGVVLALVAGAAYNYRTEGRDVSFQQKSSPAMEISESVAIRETPVEPGHCLKKPLEGKIVGVYSEQNPIWNETLEQWQTHPGIDIAAATGEAVFSAESGVVDVVYRDKLYGNTIVIDIGNNRKIRYSSLNTLQLVVPGQKVTKGEVISSAGTCPIEAHLGSHLHLEFYENEEAFDITNFFSE